MKQALIINSSLKLPKGKMAAQVAHAAIVSFLDADLNTQRKWEETGMPKIVLRVLNETALLEIQQQAISLKIPSKLIRDAGKTVVESGTITCLGCKRSRL